MGVLVVLPFSLFPFSVVFFCLLFPPFFLCPNFVLSNLKLHCSFFFSLAPTDFIFLPQLQLGHAGCAAPLNFMCNLPSYSVLHV